MASDDRSKPALEGGAPVRVTPLPFHRVSIKDRDIAAVTETLSSGWLTVGPKTEALEKRLADYLGVSNVIAVSSCSEAMLIGLKSLGVGPGDEVITSPLTFASTIHAVIHAGATPVLADVESETWGIDPEAVRAKAGPKTRAVLPVHFGGQACRIEEICEFARGRGIAVMEDAAHSFGARVSGARIGSFGDATAFSFYATKNLTTGEGGALSTNDAELAERMRLLSYHGMSRDSWARYTDKGSWYYEVITAGHKSNMSDLSAALGLSQLDRADDMLSRRRDVAARFAGALSGDPHFQLPVERPGNLHTWHLYVVQLRLDALRIDRDRFIEALKAENIGSSVHFIPVHTHPFFAPYRDGETFPVCTDYFSRCISLPIFPDMSDSDVDDVITAVKKIAAYYSAV